MLRRLFALSCITVGLLFGVFLVRDYKDRLEFTCDNVEIIVVSGDTLWDIVRSNCHGNKNEALDYHVQVYGTNLQIGQHIFLASNQDCLLTLTVTGDVWENC